MQRVRIGLSALAVVVGIAGCGSDAPVRRRLNDAGTSEQRDASRRDDASVFVDGGDAPDARSSLDAGHTIDAGFDGGTLADAAFPRDAARPPRADAGPARASASFHAPGMGAIDVTAFAVSANGTVAVGGGFRGEYVFGTTRLRTDCAASASCNQAFFVVLSPDLDVLFADVFATSTTSSLAAIDIDDTGTVLIAGSSDQPSRFGATPVTPSARNDAFLAVLDVAGALRWVHGFGSSALVTSAKRLADGGAVAAGFFAGSVTLDREHTLPSDRTGVFLARFDASGAVIWGRSFATDGIGVVSADVHLGVDPETGTALLVGTSTIDVDFGGGPLRPGPWLAAFDGHAVHLHSRSVGTRRASDVLHVFGDTFDVVFAPPTAGSVDLGTGSHTASVTTAQLDVHGGLHWIVDTAYGISHAVDPGGDHGLLDGHTLEMFDAATRTSTSRHVALPSDARIFFDDPAMQLAGADVYFAPLERVGAGDTRTTHLWVLREPRP